MKTWVLYVSGRDYRGILTCVQIHHDWLKDWRLRCIQDGGRIIAIYREKIR